MPTHCLFDASAVVDVVLGRGGGDVEIDVLFDEHWLDLTRYEAVNAVWKLGLARDEMRDAEIDDAVDVLDRLDGEIHTEVATGPAAMDAARESGLTVYDAAYLAVARRDGFTLVTEDSALRDAADELGLDTAQVQTLA